MDDIVKRIQNFELIKTLYSHTLFDIESICDEYGYWDSLTEEEKTEYKEISKRKKEEAVKYLKTEEAWEYVSKLKELKTTYGEIKKKGVDTFYNFISQRVDINQKSVFYDIGSGHGKIVLHMSLISNFGKFVGVEIDKVRYMYSEYIKSQINDSDNVIMINDDVRNIDISDATVVFMNDLLFDDSDIEFIISKLKPGTHLVSISDNSLTPDEILMIQPDWQDTPLAFKYYKLK
jgi:hypothetical protein